MSEKNPFAQAFQPTQWTLEAAPALLDVLELTLEEEVLAITRPIDGLVPQLILLIDGDKADVLRAQITQTATRLGEEISVWRETLLKEINWVAQVQKDFPPFRVGRFYVYGSHVDGAVPANHLPLLIDAAAAFGTGEHATTAGCLRALLQVRKRRAHAPRILDMGCGTAILAIAAARLWRSASIDACDNDATAVHVAALNVRANHVPQVQSFLCNGYKTRRVGMAGRYDIIVANILARPLMRMARDAAQHLAPHGTLILSGLLMSQVRMVERAYHMQGLRTAYVLPQGRWAVLVMRRAG